MTTDNAVWYKQPWLWFILSFPMAAIVIGLSMLYVGIVTYDGVVVDALQRDGRMMRVVDDQDRIAREQNLKAELTWSTDLLRVELSGVVSGYPDNLDMHFVYPTRRNRDIYLVLTHQGRGIYSTPLTEEIVGEYQVQLHPPLEQTQWRVQIDRMIFPPDTQTVELLPRAQ